MRPPVPATYSGRTATLTDDFDFQNFLLVPYCDHSPIMDRFELGIWHRWADRQTDRQADGRTYRIAEFLTAPFRRDTSVNP